MYEDSANSMVIRCGTLLDGVGNRQHDMALTVSGGRITAITPWRERGPGPARQIDGGNFTVLPGLFDCHDHLASPSRDLAEKASTPPSLHVLQVARVMAEMLQAGFTTVRDCGGLDLGLKVAVERGLVAGPRVLISLAIITQTAGLSDFTNATGFSSDVLRLPGTPEAVCDGVDGARHTTRRLIRGGADFIKIAVTGGVSSRISGILTREFSYDEVQAVVDEARAFGKPVAAHAYGGEGLRNALRAGVHSVEHLGPLDDDDIATMVRHGTYLVPTLTNMWVRGELAAVPGALSSYSIQKAQELAPLQRDAFARAYRAGVRIAAGTDSRGLRQGGNGRELGLLVSFGMTPMDGIRAATSVAAECCAVPDAGRLAVGYRADLIMVNDDPLRNIDVFADPERIAFVMRDGLVLKDRVGGMATESKEGSPGACL